MVDDLNFEWNPQRGESVAKFVSVGPVSVQMQRAKLRNVVVQGNLPGLEPSFVAEYAVKNGAYVSLCDPDEQLLAVKRSG